MDCICYGKTGKPRHSSMVGQIESHVSKQGVTAVREFTVFNKEKYVGAIDLFLTDGMTRIAVEVEFSADRVPADLIKANLACAHQLLIVVPNYRVKQAINRKLQKHSARTNTLVFIQYLSEALEQLTVNFAPA